MNRSDFSRRDVLRLGAAGLVTGAFPAAVAAAPSRKVGLGVQLYSVRDFSKKDFDGTLERIAKMGFEGVEFAGYFNYNGKAKELRKRLDDLGLKAAGTHIGARSFEGDALKKTIDFHSEIGCTLLIVPGDGRFSHPEKSKQYAEVMNKAAEALKPHGLYCGHHNHTKEFAKAEGTTYWHLFGQRTTKDVVLQLDVGWSRVAKQDSVALIKAFPGRIKTTHIKAKPPKGQGKHYVGQDNFDWAAVFAACRKHGGTEWFNIEQEDYPDGNDSMTCTEMSLKGMKKILAEMGS